jgi:hypothetical protein
MYQDARSSQRHWVQYSISSRGERIGVIVASNREQVTREWSRGLNPEAP